MTRSTTLLLSVIRKRRVEGNGYADAPDYSLIIRHLPEFERVLKDVIPRAQPARGNVQERYGQGLPQIDSRVWLVTK